MSDFLSLYKLTPTEEPYSVARIIDTDLQASAGCKLPDDTPLDLNLPSIAVVLPPLECKFDNLVPLIPLPNFCHPTVRVEIESSSCDTDIVSIDTSTLEVERREGCDFVLKGSIDICPNPGICTDFSVLSGFMITTSGDGLSGGGALLVNYDDCSLQLGGVVNIDADIKCVDAVTGGGIVTPSGAGISGDIYLSDNGKCGVEINGSITLDVKCVDNVGASGTVPVTGNGASGGIYLIPNTPCGVTLGGTISLDAECATGITGSGTVTPTGEGIRGSIGVQNKGVCGVELYGEITLDVVCTTAVTGTGSITPSGSGISGTISLSSDGECGVSLEGSISLDVVCVNAVTGSGTVTVTGMGGSGYVTLSDDGECGVSIDGSIDIDVFCTNALEHSGSITVTAYGNPDGDVTSSVSLTSDGCNAILDGTIEIYFPLSPVEAPKGSSIATNQFGTKAVGLCEGTQGQWFDLIPADAPLDPWFEAALVKPVRFRSTCGEYDLVVGVPTNCANWRLPNKTLAEQQKEMFMWNKISDSTLIDYIKDSVKIGF